MATNILNPLIPVGWSLYKPTRNVSLRFGDNLLDGLIQENWNKPIPEVPPSMEYLDPKNWPLAIPALSNLNAPATVHVKEEEVNWKEPVISPRFIEIMNDFDKFKLRNSMKKSNTDNGPYSLFWKEK
jgi:hypothetical protein